MAYEIPRQFYSAALKREAIHRVRHEGKSPERVARELALSSVRLCEWLAADGLGAFSEFTPDPGELPDVLVGNTSQSDVFSLTAARRSDSRPAN